MDHGPKESDRSNKFSGKGIMQCISKEAYFHRENNQLTILSVSAECNKRLMDVIQYAKTIPEELHVHITNVAEEEILRRLYKLCELSIADDVNEKTVKWLLIDCNETTTTSEKNSTRSKIKWVIISIITVVTITIVIIVATYYCYITQKKQIKEKQQKQEQRQRHHLQLQQQSQQASSLKTPGKLNEVTDRTILASASITQITNSSDSKLIQNTKEKTKTKQNELKEINERINRQSDEEFQQERKELIAFYKQVRQCFPERTEKTQEQSGKKQSSEENDSSSLNSNES
uniref:Alba domain-containing protein n=1 Tax=Loa loa TaxID=7209 RepID=A0A1I7VMH1_LOALO